MQKLSIVMYHYVRDLKNSRYPEIKGLDYELFKQQIQFISEKFHVVRMEDVIAYYKNGDSLPENAMLLTFDDGYIDSYTFVLPVLKKYGMQGSFFVPGKAFAEHCLLDVNKIHYLLASAPIEVLCKELFAQLDDYRGNGWEYPSNDELFAQYEKANRFDKKETVFFKRILQVALPEKLRKVICDNLFCKYVDVPEEVLAREIYVNMDQMKFMKSEGMYFGIHGYNHYWMNQMDPAVLREDISKGLTSMKGLIDEKEWVMNYPYGSYSKEVVAALNNSGCVLGLSSDVRIADLEKDDRFILPRLDTNDFPPKSENYLKF